MRKDILVYVAGPISQGDLATNIRRAISAGMTLMKAGLSVIVPHDTCFWGMACDNGGAYIPEVLPAGTTHADWVGMDLIIVRRVDAVLRLPGLSVGADLEVAEAELRDIPVFHSAEEVLEWASRNRAAPDARR